MDYITLQLSVKGHRASCGLNKTSKLIAWEYIKVGSCERIGLGHGVQMRNVHIYTPRPKPLLLGKRVYASF